MLRQLLLDALAGAAAVAIAGIFARGAARRRRPAPQPPAVLPRCHCSACRPEVARG